MSAFDDLLNEFLGNSTDVTDIRAVVRRCYFYDFLDSPLFLWEGQGNLITEDGVEWIGTIDQNGIERHIAPPIQDGRDGTSATYSFSMVIPDLEIYETLKSSQSLAVGRDLIIYLAIFDQGEALRPSTPIIFFKKLTILAPRFSEKMEADGEGKLTKKYLVTLPTKDDNYGRTKVPNGTYTDTIQKYRAAQQGVTLDKGCEYVATLANRTLQIP